MDPQASSAAKEATGDSARRVAERSCPSGSRTRTRFPRANARRSDDPYVQRAGVRRPRSVRLAGHRHPHPPP